MDKHEAFAVWAPAESIWTPWAKPVLFAHLMGSGAGEAAGPAVTDVAAFLQSASGARTAVVVDLPGPSGVVMAPALAAAGYRPVPLYNAVPPGMRAGGAQAAVAVDAIARALETVAPALRAAAAGLSADAPPAFLLDAVRGVAMAPLKPGDFDNRSVSLPTDFPSAAFLMRNGVRRVLLVRADDFEPLPDLAHTLLRYQQAGLEVLAASLAEAGAARAIRVRRPAWYRNPLQRLLAVTGLRRGPFGGFGGTLPEPSAG